MANGRLLPQHLTQKGSLTAQKAGSVAGSRSSGVEPIVKSGGPNPADSATNISSEVTERAIRQPCSETWPTSQAKTAP
ncbi:MAG: hypothetical protein ACO31C_06920 [Schleiferiaceae bacterium]